MANISVTLTDTELKALGYVAVSPQEWAENAIKDRCRIAVDEIVGLYTERALGEGIQIPTTKDALVADAFIRGWVKSAADIVAERVAEQTQEEPVA
jgi:hypothetical protein